MTLDTSSSDVLGTIQVKLLNNDTPQSIPYTKTTSAETIVRHLCKHLHIKPLMAPLFAIKISNTNIWLNSSLLVASKIEFFEKSQLILRVRWKINDVMKIRHLDLATYNYYFLQVNENEFKKKKTWNCNNEGLIVPKLKRKGELNRRKPANGPYLTFTLDGNRTN
jgi:hypothetical protein